MKKLLLCLTAIFFAFSMVSCAKNNSENQDDFEIQDSQESQDSQGGSKSDGADDVVLTPTEGIVYEFSEDGTYAIVTEYKGTETDVVIAHTYEGVPVMSIGDEAFSECLLITSVIIPDSVTSIGDGAFCDCSALARVTIGKSVAIVGYYAFYGCFDLVSIDVSTENPNYKSIDGNVYTKDEKMIIQYAIGKTEKSFAIPNGVVGIGAASFEQCKNLTSVVIPDSVTNIGDGAFADCENLVSVVVGNGVTDIDGDAFYSCDSLTAVVIPDSVKSIGDDAFRFCKKLTSVIIGKGIESIGDDVFTACENLTDVYYTCSEEKWGEISIASGNDCLTESTIHYNYVPED